MRCDARARRQAGFTLLELLVVLAVLGLAAGIVATRAGPRPELRLAAGELQDMLRGARAQAIGANRTVTVLMQAEPPGIGIVGSRMLPLPAGIGFAPGTSAAIAFAPDGSASGGALVLGNSRATMRIEVEALTGRVRVAGAR